MTIAVLHAGVVLQLLALAIGHAGDVEKQAVVGAVRPGILDGNVAINAVERAVEVDDQVLANGHGAVLGDGDIADEVGDVPLAGESGGSEGEAEEDRSSGFGNV